jgi:hypothetical protein
MFSFRLRWFTFQFQFVVCRNLTCPYTICESLRKKSWSAPPTPSRYIVYSRMWISDDKGRRRKIVFWDWTQDHIKQNFSAATILWPCLNLLRHRWRIGRFGIHAKFFTKIIANETPAESYIYMNKWHEACYQARTHRQSLSRHIDVWTHSGYI